MPARILFGEWFVSAPWLNMFSLREMVILTVKLPGQDGARSIIGVTKCIEQSCILCKQAEKQ